MKFFANMQSIYTRSHKNILLFLLLCSSFYHAFADNNDGGILETQTVKFTGVTATGTSKSLAASQYASLSYTAATEQSKKIRTIVSLSVHEETSKLIPDNFTAKVTFSIDFKLTPTSSIITTQKTLTVDYQKGSGNKYSAKNYFSIPDAVYVKLTIVSVTDGAGSSITIVGTGPTAIDMRDVIMLQGEMQVTRYFELVSNAEVTNAALSIGTAPSGVTPDFALVTWQMPTHNPVGNNACQIEWTWLEDEVQFNYINGTDVDINFLFKNNATRVDIPYNVYEYKIPILYDGAGKLYVRIRPVNIQASGNRADGNWVNTEPLSFTGHEPDLNWQVTTSFAEEGKYKTVIGYFDGSLRSKQTVTKDNVTGNVLTSETFYDYQGRPAVQILPTPSIASVIKYHQGVNQFNTQTSITEDPAYFFDLQPLGLTTYATELLKTTTGSSNYYSSSNTQNGNAENKFIPDAQGYPFTVTRYTPDATGRVMAQSGVGATHKMGTDQVTKYYYGTAAQVELDGLFGTEVGNYTHYSKNMVKDANGQMSVSYVDMHGRTIATALAGDAPSNLAPVNALLYPNPNFGNLIHRNLLDKNTNVIKNNNAIESVTALLVPVTTNYKFTYALNPQSLQLMDCSNHPICYDCMYNLEITITDESGEQNQRKYTYNNIKLYADDSCNTPITPFIEGGIPVDDTFGPGGGWEIPVGEIPPIVGEVPHINTFEINASLIPGSYSIRKTLTISESSLEKYKRQYESIATCESFQTILNTVVSTLTTATGCASGGNPTGLTCQDCITALGSEAGFRTLYLSSLTGVTITQSIEDDIHKMYMDELAKCDKLCGTVSQAMPTIREMMLADMMPFTGQYAKGNDWNNNHAPSGTSSDPGYYDMHHKYDVFSIYNISGLPFYKFPQNPSATASVGSTTSRDYYYDNNQKDITIHPENNYNLLDGKDEAAFAQLFKNSWTNSLLPYHPEYDKLIFAEDPTKLAPSYTWINSFSQQAAYPTTTHLDWITVPGINSSSIVDPFYTYSGGNPATTPIDYFTLIYDKVNIEYFSGTGISMWQLAYGDLNCKSIGNQSTRDACYLALPKNPAAASSTLYASTALTAAENNRIWSVFKGLYMAERNRQVNDYINQIVPLSDASTLADHKYLLHFPLSDEQAITQLDTENNGSWLPTTPGGAPIGSNLVNPSTNTTASYESKCDSYIATWKAQLLNCPTIMDLNETDRALLLAEVAAGMKDVCIRGSDAANPNGASNVSPANIGSGPNSFEEVIIAAFTKYGVTKTNLCTPYVIEWPKKRDQGPAITSEVITALNECTCERYSQIKHEADGAKYNPNDYGELNAYLLATYGETLTEELFNNLNQHCSELNFETCYDQITTVRWNICEFQEEPSCDEGSLSKITIEDECRRSKQCTTNICTYSYILPQPQLLPQFLKCGYTSTSRCLNCAQLESLTNSFVAEFSSLGSPYNIAPSYTSNSVLTDIEIERNVLFAQYLNYNTGMQYTWTQYLEAAKNVHCELSENVEQSVVCPSTKPLNTGDGFGTPPDACQLTYNMAFAIAQQIYKQRIETKLATFEQAYRNKCLNVQEIETFSIDYQNKEYHYTLYYYDQAGNLVKTVPPQGVKPNYTNRFLEEVAAKRASFLETDIYDEEIPSHNLITQYRYNSLNQVVAQSTPDAGISKFWYDALGRLVVSQNAKQAAANKYSYTLYDGLGRINEVGQLPHTNPITNAIAKTPSQLQDWLHKVSPFSSPGVPEQVTHTVYDKTYFDGDNSLCPEYLCQQNLRNRVSYTAVYDQLDEVGATVIGEHTTATYYTYDIHGNVDILLQDYGNSSFINNVMNETSDNRYKKISYEYDLISGKVNRVNYQPGKIDQFYHRYQYDAENRLTQVFTSQDDILWERDAAYKYYKHGPLARTILGQQQVQGVDYAYTIQGWLKGVNTTAISAMAEGCLPGTANSILNVNSRAQYGQPNLYLGKNQINFEDGFASVDGDNFSAEIDVNAATCQPTAGNYINGDMGNDGDATPPASGQAAPNTNIARDAFGFSLNYFRGDYTPINTGYQPFAILPNTPLPSLADGVQTGSNLFNGNIGSMMVNIAKLGEAKLYAYRYDQLNRIVAMNSYTGFNNQGNTFGTSGPAVSNDYKERVSYDANGNTLTYLRNGTTQGGNNQAMDQMTYGYNKDANGRLIDNKLKHVKDAIGNSNYTEDIDNQDDDNYKYDDIGNLVIDKAEGIYDPTYPTKPMIEWTVYGKISKVTKIKSGATTTIEYTYDASGNRISKTINSAATGLIVTWYVRDASGNVMAVYEKKPTINDYDLTQTEVHLYGSSRIGLWNINRNVTDTEIPTPHSGSPLMNTFTRGNKLFELSNHLGNVLVTINDKKLQIDDGTYQQDCSGAICFYTNVKQSTTLDGVVDYYMADVVTANDYYPFGMAMPGRQFSAGGEYRYGFNGKENDKAVGEGVQDYGMRIYDARLGKFLSVDPIGIEFPWNSSYAFAENSPIKFIDLDGGEKITPEQLETAKNFLRIEGVSCLKTQILIYVTKDKKIINDLKKELETHKKSYAYWCSVVYKNRASDVERSAYFFNTAIDASLDVVDMTPIGDAKVLFTGTNWKGEKSNRYLAGGMILFNFFGGEILTALSKSKYAFGSFAAGLRYANKFGECKKFANEFMKIFGNVIERGGGNAIQKELQATVDFGIVQGGKSVTHNGYHTFIEIINDGKTFIIDNLNPKGVLKEKYIETLEVATGGKVYFRQAAYDLFKAVTISNK